MAPRALEALAAISPSAALDRLIRGRLWIGLLAFALIGIVAMQLVVLKLNTGIGRTLTREATLQRENAQLGIEDSMYSAESRVGPLAAAAGMTLAPTGAVHFVQAVPTDLSRAASALAAPMQMAQNVQTGSAEGEARASQPSEAPAGSVAGGGSASSATSAVAGASEASGASGPSDATGASGSGHANNASGSSETSSASGSSGANSTEASGASAPTPEETSSSPSSAGG